MGVQEGLMRGSRMTFKTTSGDNTMRKWRRHISLCLRCVYSNTKKGVRNPMDSVPHSRRRMTSSVGGPSLPHKPRAERVIMGARLQARLSLGPDHPSSEVNTGVLTMVPTIWQNTDQMYWIR